MPKAGYDGRHLSFQYTGSRNRRIFVSSRPISTVRLSQKKGKQINKQINILEKSLSASNRHFSL